MKANDKIKHLKAWCRRDLSVWLGMSQACGRQQFLCHQASARQAVGSTSTQAHRRNSGCPGPPCLGLRWRDRRLKFEEQGQWRAASSGSPGSHSNGSNSSTDKQAKSGADIASDSGVHDLLPLEELQKASDAASEGPLDSSAPASSSGQNSSKDGGARPLQSAFNSVLLRWERIGAAVKSFLVRLAAILSWIPAVARHRKLVKLKAEVQEDPQAPDK